MSASIGYSLSKAKDADAKRRVQKAQNPFFEITVDTKSTFEDLAEWYLSLEHVKTLASYHTIRLNLNKFNQAFGKRPVASVRPSELKSYQTRLLKTLAPATVDHVFGKTRTMIRAAVDDGLLAPEVLHRFFKIKKTLKKGQDVRDRVLSATEFEVLMQELPKHLQWITATAYFTGMRRGEILSLTWDKVDLKKRLI